MVTDVRVSISTVTAPAQLSAGPLSSSPLSSSRALVLAHSRKRRALCSGLVTVTTFPFAIATNDQLAEYGPDMDCQWLLQAPVWAYPVVTITALDTESPLDYFAIYNGATTAGTQLYLESGSVSEPPTVYGTSSTALAQFLSDSSIEYAGVTATAAYLCGPGTISTTITSVGSIASSVGMNYINGMSCTWSIQAPVGNRVQLGFQTSRTETCCDFLSVFNGTSTAATRLGIYSGTISAFTLTSVGTALTVAFSSDGGTTFAGFQATIAFLRE
jgi:hypothetical protein